MGITGHAGGSHFYGVSPSRGRPFLAHPPSHHLTHTHTHTHTRPHFQHSSFPGSIPSLAPRAYPRRRDEAGSGGLRREGEGRKGSKEGGAQSGRTMRYMRGCPPTCSHIHTHIYTHACTYSMRTHTHTLRLVREGTERRPVGRTVSRPAGADAQVLYGARDGPSPPAEPTWAVLGSRCTTVPLRARARGSVST